MWTGSVLTAIFAVNACPLYDCTQKRYFASISFILFSFMLIKSFFSFSIHFNLWFENCGPIFGLSAYQNYFRIFVNIIDVGYA